MNKLTDETFFAWLDGEITGAEADEVAALVAADPELSARAARHRALAGRLRTAFDPIAAAPVPERIANPLCSPQPQIVSLAGRRSAVSKRRFGGVPQWAAMAASLALGMFVGALALSGDGGSVPFESRDGAIYAAGPLDSALERQLASADAGGQVRIGLTFRDRSGSICRSFTGQSSSGLACRDGNDWRLRGLVAAPEGQSGDYRMAAGQDPMLAELIETAIDGDPFDAEQESQAQERGWR